MQTVYRKLSELKKLPNNPRIIKDAQFKTLCESIKNNPEYFEARPIILSNRTGENIIIAGNQRYEASKTVGLKQVPTYLIEGLTEAKEREISIRDNISNGEWDYDLLANEWDTDELSEWGIDLAIGEEFKKDFSIKEGTVIYEPKNTNHKTSELFTYNSSIEEIFRDIKDVNLRKLFLLRAAMFTDFHFNKIADYYAYQAKEKEKRIIEKMGLVLLDRDQLIENGFSKLFNDLDNEEEE